MQWFMYSLKFPSRGVPNFRQGVWGATRPPSCPHAYMPGSATVADAPWTGSEHNNDNDNNVLQVLCLVSILLFSAHCTVNVTMTKQKYIPITERLSIANELWYAPIDSNYIDLGIFGSLTENQCLNSCLNNVRCQAFDYDNIVAQGMCIFYYGTNPTHQIKSHHDTANHYDVIRVYNVPGPERYQSKTVNFLVVWSISILKYH